VDISRYKNIPVPTSYMAIRSDYDFVGGYENDTRGGLLHVANHHVSPGKKQWTWGNGDFGKAWDRNLTDVDGPYIELMCGVHTDNQPDFSWIMPYEERSFTQYFMPYRDLGVVKNATKEAMVNLEIENGIANIKAYTTAGYPGAKVILEAKGKNVLNETFDFSPKNSFEKTVTIDTAISAEDLCIIISDQQGKILVAWQPEKTEIRPIPDAAKAARLPEEISSIEQLYLTGLHLEQYRHATYLPTDYYQEALKREPGDVRSNNAMGLWYLRRGKFAKAEPFFRASIATLTERNPNPYDGEPYFNLGLCLRMQYKYTEAYEAFFKATWNVAWQDAAYFQLAQIACLQNRYDDALDLVERSLLRNWHNHKARHLKVAVLRLLNRKEEALALIEASLTIDKFNFGLYFEKHLLADGSDALDTLKFLMRGYIHNYMEIALDYAAAGLFEQAISFLEDGVKQQKEVFPMAWYYLGWFARQHKDMVKAKAFYEKAAKALPDYCFPNQLESVLALQDAIQVNPSDAKAHYYLGNVYYHWRWYREAWECWDTSIKLDKSFPTVHRNLALTYFNKQGDAAKALASMETAFALDKTDARILMELDQLYKKLNYSPEKRLNHLKLYPDLVAQRDDLYLEQVTLLNSLSKHQQAYDLLMKRKFHPWEGGEGKATGQYMLSLVEMAKSACTEGAFEKAIDFLEKAKAFPENLGEGKLYGAQENDIHYWLGCAFAGTGNTTKASEYWQLASTGLSEPAQAFFYNDQQPDKIYYQGMALLKLGKENEAHSRFNKLVDYGEKHIFDTIRIDYFAVSLPDLLIWDDDLTRRNKIHCHYMMGLGHLGLAHKPEAKKHLGTAYDMDLNHQGVWVHKLIC
jgi:tetratricopeptide (TPR) repeat protein